MLTLRDLVREIDQVVNERNGRERVWGEAEEDDLAPDLLREGLADVDEPGDDVKVS
jgi:hypothetical protein